MAMKFLKFGNHFLKTAFYLARDVIIGHIYKKKYVEQTVDALYMQVFRPKESITVNSVLTYDTVSVTTSANGIMILEGDGSTDTSKWKIVASTMEQVHHRSYADIDEVREDLFKYIELFNNRKRLHSSLGYLTPVAYRLQKLIA